MNDVMPTANGSSLHRRKTCTRLKPEVIKSFQNLKRSFQSFKFANLFFSIGASCLGFCRMFSLRGSSNNYGMDPLCPDRLETSSCATMKLHKPVTWITMRYWTQCMTRQARLLTWNHGITGWFNLMQTESRGCCFLCWRGVRHHTTLLTQMHKIQYLVFWLDFSSFCAACITAWPKWIIILVLHVHCIYREFDNCKSRGYRQQNRSDTVPMLDSLPPGPFTARLVPATSRWQNALS